MKIKPYTYFLFFIVLMNVVLLVYALDEISDINNLNELNDLNDIKDNIVIGIGIISVIMIFIASFYIYKISFS